MHPSHAFEEHRITTPSGWIYARDHAGDGPAYVLMHGFPDHVGIYDELVPHLVAAGRRVVAFDFLGFGRSELRPGSVASFAQQRDDLKAVVDALRLGQVVPVAHDASGPAAINFALDHPERVASLCILNAAYDDADPVLWPELITLFATPALAALSQSIAGDPTQFGWLLAWQQKRFGDSLPAPQRAHFETGMGRLIADHFSRKPGPGPAFVRLAAGFFEELARNTARIDELGRLDRPVKVIWGEFDPYITVDAANRLASRFARASVRLLPGGHWIQSDRPADVAREMLS